MLVAATVLGACGGAWAMFESDLGVAAAAFLVAAVSAGAIARRARASQVAAGWIALDPRGLTRESPRGVARLVDFSERFGVTVLASDARDRGLLAFTTATQTRTVRIHALPREAAAARELFASAAPAIDADVVSNVGDDALSATDALDLVRALRARAPEAFTRIVLTDSRGAPVVLDGGELEAGGRVIDLERPLEWRAFAFVESAGALSTVVQATWVRQLGSELLFVAPMPDGVRRTPRGLHVSIDAPPPADGRLAIERLFMAPLRAAIARAPKASRASLPPVEPRSEGRSL